MAHSRRSRRCARLASRADDATSRTVHTFSAAPLAARRRVCSTFQDCFLVARRGPPGGRTQRGQPPGSHCRAWPTRAASGPSSFMGRGRRCGIRLCVQCAQPYRATRQLDSQAVGVGSMRTRRLPGVACTAPRAQESTDGTRLIRGGGHGDSSQDDGESAQAVAEQVGITGPHRGAPRKVLPSEGDRAAGVHS